MEEQLTATEQRSDQVGPPKKKRSSLAMASFVCGVIACSLNLTVVLAVIGFIPGLLAILFGLAAKPFQNKAKAGFILGLFSFFIIIVWTASVLSPLVIDPTI